MGVPETDEIVGELYLVPPARFVAARDELVRQARQAGHRQLAYRLQSLRRPTLSAWLVNLLTRYERVPMDDLSALGRQLRHAQVRLDAAQLRQLSARRKPLVSDLVERARRRAVEAGLDPTDKVLSEVESTLNAALVDLAAASTVMSGRLVRPMSHSGFGPMPAVDRPAAPPPSPAAPAPAGAPAAAPAAVPAGDGGAATGERWVFWPVADLPGQDPAGRPADRDAGLRADRGARRPADPVRPVSLAEARQQRKLPAQAEATNPANLSNPTAAAEDQLHRAESVLAAAESRHWQREHELADAEAALEAARDRLQWLEQQRLEARAAKATAERHLAQARSAQRAAVREVAEARRALHAAEARLRHDGANEPRRE